MKLLIIWKGCGQRTNIYIFAMVTRCSGVKIFVTSFDAFYQPMPIALRTRFIVPSAISSALSAPCSAC